jgi:hypothetical protein
MKTVLTLGEPNGAKLMRQMLLSRHELAVMHRFTTESIEPVLCRFVHLYGNGREPTRAALHPSSPTASAMASSRDIAWPTALAAANASSPSAARAAFAAWS